MLRPAEGEAESIADAGARDEEADTRKAREMIAQRTVALHLTTKHFLALGAVCVLLGCGGASKPGTPSVKPQAHSFGIYLVIGKWDRPWTPATLGDVGTLLLDPRPVISDADIMSYSLANHAMIVRPQALSRLPQPSVFHAPFVVVADGQRIYLGAFATTLSSCSSSVPTILVDHIPMDAQRWSFQGGTNTLVIDRAYPAAGFGFSFDPRSDGRIQEALAGLKKLK